MRKITIPDSALERYALLNIQDWDDIQNYGIAGYTKASGLPANSLEGNADSLEALNKILAEASTSKREAIVFYVDVYLGAGLMYSTDVPFPSSGMIFSTAPLIQCAQTGRCMQEINREMMFIDNPGLGNLIRGSDDNIETLCDQIKEIVPSLTSKKLVSHFLLREPLPPEKAHKAHKILAAAFKEPAPEKPLHFDFRGAQGVQ